MAGTVFGTPFNYQPVPSIGQSLQIPQQLLHLQQLEYLQQQQLQQLQQVVQVVAQQLQQLQQIVQFIPQQLQHLHQQLQTQSSPFGIAGLPGLGAPQSAAGTSGWIGSQTFYPQSGQVM